MSKIVLETLVNSEPAGLPEFYKQIDITTFGIDWKLFDYQQKAVRNILNTLFYYFNDAEKLVEAYDTKLSEETRLALNVNEQNSNFEFLSEFYEVIDDSIDFNNFTNRASCWMATGSGKTLVIVKIIEILYLLIKNSLIPKKDIVILAPKNEILEQIKEHINKFNTNGNLTIELRDLREFERIKYSSLDLFADNKVTIFYYRSDNITDIDKTELLSYKTILNNSNWYILLDEAHKGDSEDSIRQQYYTILSKNGFLFNFSATFTDTIDIVSTAYNFNLKKFIDSGFGKHIKISGEEFRGFRKTKDNPDFNDEEKKLIVLKSLITYTAVKKSAEFIHTKSSELYHNPLLVTIANEVNTVEADLKLFFQQLAIIATGDFNLEQAKFDLQTDFNTNRKYQFETAEISNSFIQTILDISKQDIIKYVFNATAFGTIEYTLISGNSREVAFRLKTAESGKHFCLLVASDATKWSSNVLENYELSETPLTESYFKDISSRDSDINILLGSRIFAEGWDSNRPNIINFINIGVDSEAQKFILQAMGRGVRIQPVNSIRKRLQFFSIDENTKLKSIITNEQIKDITKYKHDQIIESLFVFATNKEVISKIIDNLNKERDDSDWKTIKGILKNDISEKLLIPEYSTEFLELPDYKISQAEFDSLVEYIGEDNSERDRLLLLNTPDNLTHSLIATINKVRNNNKILVNGINKNNKPYENLLLINSHFNQKQKAFKGFKEIQNEITHFEYSAVNNLSNTDLQILEETIFNIVNARYSTPDEVLTDFQNGNISREQFRIEYDRVAIDLEFVRPAQRVKINKKFIKEHYYKPILIAEQNFENMFQHIVKEESEAKFISDLETNKSCLDKYSWWYFSKIDESIDKLSIPYFDTETQKFRDFYPDFIFWLRTEDTYYIKFVDPKGRKIGLQNAKSKANGFLNTFKDIDQKVDNIPIKIELFFFNAPPSFNELDAFYKPTIKEIFE